LTPLVVRTPSVIADQVFALPRDGLGHLGQEVQRIEDLEVAFGTRQQVFAGGFGEPPQPAFQAGLGTTFVFSARARAKVTASRTAQSRIMAVLSDQVALRSRTTPPG
jgi:hypothetical protein